MFANFRIGPARIDLIRQATAGSDKHLDWFETDVVNPEGQVIAKVRKQLYIRLKEE